MGYEKWSSENRDKDTEDTSGMLKELQEFIANHQGEKISVLPCDSLSEGKVGFILFSEKRWNPVVPTEDTTIGDTTILERRIFPKGKEIFCETREEFDTIFDDALNKDYLLLSVDDPKQLMLGFIVVRNSGAVWYRIRLSNYLRK